MALDEGINTSDVDLISLGGKTHVYYTAGDQRTWMNTKRATFDGSERAFLEHWFATPGIKDAGTAAADAARAVTEARRAK